MEKIVLLEEHWKKDKNNVESIFFILPFFLSLEHGKNEQKTQFPKQLFSTTFWSLLFLFVDSPF